MLSNNDLELLKRLTPMGRDKMPLLHKYLLDSSTKHRFENKRLVCDIAGKWVVFPVYDLEIKREVFFR